MPLSPTFSVCTIAREEAAVLDRFVRFYLQAGAEKIFLNIDGPDPGFENPDPARVEVRTVDDVFLEANGAPTPTTDLSTKQRALYGIRFRDLESDWMFFVDTDEFLTGPDSIGALLARAPSNIEALSVRNAEAVWGPGDDLDEMFGCTHFRLPLIGWREHCVWMLYGADAPLFRKGLLGHLIGKTFVRRGTQADIFGAHGPKRNGKDLKKQAHVVDPALSGYILAHYDAISFSRWREKLRIRIDGTITASRMGAQREMQMQRCSEALSKGERATRDLFKKFYGLSRPQTLILKGIGRLIRLHPFEGVDT